MRADARLVASVYNPDNTSKRRDPFCTALHVPPAFGLNFGTDVLGGAKMADRLVLYEVDDKVGIITLNRPEKLNAISAELQQALTEALTRGDADPATSVVLLRAEGRSFCAGYDISAREPGTDDWRDNPTKAHDHLHPQLEFEMTPWTMKKPVIASVQGHVLGGGCELVMLCDLTIAADNATFGEPEVRFSSVGPAIVMPMIIGYKKARELLYFGDTIDAAAALELGMVNRVVPLAELREASLRWAKRLSLISPEALYAAKRAINRGADAAGFRTALYAGLDVVGPLYATKTEFGQKFREIAARGRVPQSRHCRCRRHCHRHIGAAGLGQHIQLDTDFTLALLARLPIEPFGGLYQLTLNRVSAAPGHDGVESPLPLSGTFRCRKIP